MLVRAQSTKTTPPPKSRAFAPGSAPGARVNQVNFTPKEKIVIGCDHAALTLKDAVKAHLLELGHEVKDFGIYQAGEKCDYPEKAAEVARYLRDGNAERGILICGTGVGMSIAANKVKGIRACCCSDTFSARMTRAHNDANILTFGERVVGQGLAMELVDAFLTTEFEGGRHQRRVDLITKLEQEENS